MPQINVLTLHVCQRGKVMGQPKIVNVPFIALWFHLVTKIISPTNNSFNVGSTSALSLIIIYLDCSNSCKSTMTLVSCSFSSITTLPFYYQMVIISSLSIFNHPRKSSLYIFFCFSRSSKVEILYPIHRHFSIYTSITSS